MNMKTCPGTEGVNLFSTGTYFYPETPSILGYIFTLCTIRPFY
ncbi:hypothetical protein E2C01_074172 [Portunus trituberculatus]|uniref:Uncharacterized protein n=1 Tax=Portunus trituberculatus TaxID=210409 RepID=A0A5B7IBP8_PORTR|nr:hypothetical protein [Portunus trituberculatus]